MGVTGYPFDGGAGYGPDRNPDPGEALRTSALHIIDNMNATLTIISRRLARIGPSASVPPQAADADGLVRQSAELRELLAQIEEGEAE